MVLSQETGGRYTYIEHQILQLLETRPEELGLLCYQVADAQWAPVQGPPPDSRAPLLFSQLQRVLLLGFEVKYFMTP